MSRILLMNLISPYCAYSAFTTGIQVKCPQVPWRGVVTADEDDAYFRCLSCGHQETRDRTIYRYDVHNQCKNCGRYYRVDIEDEAKQLLRLHVAVPIVEQPCRERFIRQRRHFPIVRRFRAARTPNSPGTVVLTSFQGKPVWALNREHLAYLIGYLSAEFQEKPSGKSEKRLRPIISPPS